MFDISDINRVKVIAEEGSFNKAAQKLFISQPALTKRIARLEDLLGMKLFHRSNKGIILTEFGKKVISDGGDIVKQMTILHRELVMMAGKEIGTLRFGVGPVIEEEILTKALANFLRDYPTIGITVKVDNAANLMTLLKDGEIDIAVGAFSNSHQYTEFTVELLGSRDVIFVARPEHPLFKNEHKKIPIQQMLQYPMAAPELPSTTEAWLKQRQKDPLSKTGYLISENYRLLCSVVKSTNHITAGPDILFSKELKSGALKILPLAEVTTWQAYIVMRPEATHAPLVQAISAMIKETFNALPS